MKKSKTGADIAARAQAGLPLRSSDELFTALIENAFDIIIIVNMDGMICYANPSVERVLGYRPSDLVGEKLPALVHPNDVSKVETFLERVKSGDPGILRDPLQIETRVRHKNESWRVLESVLKTLDTPSVMGIVVNSRDISDRKLAEALRVGQNRVLEMIAADAPLPDILGSLAQMIELQSEGMLCSIVLLDEDGTHVLHGAAPSLPQDFVDAIDGEVVDPRGGSCGNALFRGEQVVITDIQSDPLWEDYRELADRHGLRVCWSTPIISRQGRPLGSFAMYYREMREPSRFEKRLIEIGTRIAGIAIERKQAELHIRFMAHHDELTGLPNRTKLHADLAHVIEQAGRDRHMAALLFIDLDRFKHVNDSLGHEIGDRLLQAVAGRLQHCLRTGDSVARLGGDEFVICLPKLHGSNEARVVANKVLDALSQVFVVDGNELQIGSSVGISLYPGDGQDVDTLLRAADAAMYHAKENGRGHYQFFSLDLHAAMSKRLTLTNRLSHALPRREFTLNYQPQVDMECGRIIGAEALIRWPQSTGDVVLPAEFIPLAEQNGFIQSIGEWVLDEACAQLKRWHDSGHPYLRMAVNLSVYQMQQMDFGKRVEQLLNEKSLSASSLDLEITESVLMQPNEENRATLAQLSAMGIHLLIDDFGTGYSNLGYLRSFPIDTLKIDQSFVRGIGTDNNDTAIIDAIISIAHSLHLNIIAEGVETAAQSVFLQQRGCKAGQGYYYGEPLTADAFSERLLLGMNGRRLDSSI
ncbi:MAG TPA: EAL domain-containing protein [Paucimonas sp.]|nr:EAL domain-containing protein [Paucimonas sp.]